MKRALFSFFVLVIVKSFPLAQDGMQEVVINPGDTMWSIANKYLKDPQKWPEIVRANKLTSSDPTMALPGTKIRIPVTLIKEEFRTAQLVRMQADVRYKRKNETDFRAATPNMILKYEDSLRTMEGGHARVKFPTQEIIQINENSLVVLKPEKIIQEIQLVQGGVRASRAKVIMPGGTVVQPKNRNSDYQAKVRDDQSEVVFVYKGEVNVTAQGKTVRVKEGFGTHVPKAAAPLEPTPLAEFKDFNPSDMPATKPVQIKAAAPNTAPAVQPPFGDKPKASASKNMLASYHVQLAHDPEFQQIVIQKTDTTGAAFNPKTQPIPDGTYYMRVAFLDMTGKKGPYSEPATIIKDTVPPALVVSMPQEGQSFQGTESVCDVRGKVRGAVMIAVNGTNVFTSADGQFSQMVHLKEGENNIRITTRDGSQNETAVTRTVHYKKKS